MIDPQFRTFGAYPLKYATNICKFYLSQLTPPVNGALPVPRTFQELKDMEKAFDEIINSRIPLPRTKWPIALGINDKENEGQYVESENGNKIVLNYKSYQSGDDDKNDNMAMFLDSTESWATYDDEKRAYVICQQDCQTG